MPTTQGDARWPAWLAILLTLTALLLTGCYDTKQEITLNPDGTGKLVIESVFLESAFQWGSPVRGDEAKRAVPKTVTNVVQELIAETEGVEAWRDISFHQREDGKTFFRGTAYFRSLAKLKIGVGGDHRFSATIDPSGTLTISKLATPTPDNPITKPDKLVTLESIQRERALFRSLLPTLQSTIGQMRQDTTIHFPGTLLRASIFETNTPQTLRLQLDGQKWLAALEARAFDTSLDARRIAGEKFVPDDADMLANLNGQPGPIIAVIRPGTSPRFDYASEVAEARRTFPEFAQQIRPEAPPQEVPKPAVDGQPATLTVTGVEWFGADSPAQGYGAYNNRRNSYSVHLKAGLSGNVLKASKVQFTRASTIEGMDLLLTYRSSDLSAAPSTSKDGTAIFFRANLQAPPADSKGIAELSGFLDCEAMASQRTVELISGQLRAGAIGAEFDTQIDGVDPRMSGYDRLSLRTRLKPGQLRSIRVVGDAGQFSHLDQRGHTIIGDMHVITYATKIEIPRTGKIIAEVLSGEQTLKIPFALTNVTLLGQPRP